MVLMQTVSPHEWFDPFLPMPLTGMCAIHANHKTLLTNADQEDKTCPDWVPFENDELRRHIGVHIVRGLAPSPQVSMKFNSQNDDNSNNNDFVNRSLGPAAVRRHKHFVFFATQNQN